MKKNRVDVQGQQQFGNESKFTDKLTEHDKLQKDQNTEKACNRLVFTSGYGKAATMQDICMCTRRKKKNKGQVTKIHSAMLVVGLDTEHSDTLDHFILSKSGIIQKKETKSRYNF